MDIMDIMDIKRVNQSGHFAVKHIFLKDTNLPEDIINVIIKYFCKCRSYSKGLRYLLNNNITNLIMWSESKDCVMQKTKCISFEELCHHVEHSIEPHDIELRELVPIFNIHCEECNNKSHEFFQRLRTWGIILVNSKMRIPYNIHISYQPMKGVRLIISGRKINTNYYLKATDETMIFEEFVHRCVHGPLREINDQYTVNDDFLLRQSAVAFVNPL
jgi:hypothetical protein